MNLTREQRELMCELIEAEMELLDEYGPEMGRTDADMEQLVAIHQVMRDG